MKPIRIPRTTGTIRIQKDFAQQFGTEDSGSGMSLAIAVVVLHVLERHLLFEIDRFFLRGLAVTMPRVTPVRTGATE